MEEADWSRPRWDRDEARALMVYFVFGAFAAELELDLSAHGSEGLPEGVEMRRIPRAMLPHWDGHPLRGALGEILRAGDPDAFEAARKAPECMMLHGELADSASLAYLRNCLGVVSALLDAGGVSVVDPQTMTIFSADAWRERYTGNGAATPRNHVLILAQDDADGAARIKTRGMRKFARPDISVRGVPAADVQRAGALAARLVDLEAQGMRFGDGSTVTAEGLSTELTVRRAGSLDDPEFNNTHLELTWP